VDVTEVGWEQTCSLREDVLGWPAGPVPGDTDIDTTHLAVFDRWPTPVAVVSYCPRPCPERPTAAATYFWAMAVGVASQHAGLGTRLINELRERSTLARRPVMWADARTRAVDFYRACGAQVVGEPYIDDVTGLHDHRVVFDLSSIAYSRATTTPM